MCRPGFRFGGTPGRGAAGSFVRRIRDRCGPVHQAGDPLGPAPGRTRHHPVRRRAVPGDLRRGFSTPGPIATCCGSRHRRHSCSSSGTPSIKPMKGDDAVWSTCGPSAIRWAPGSWIGAPGQTPCRSGCRCPLFQGPGCGHDRHGAVHPPPCYTAGPRPPWPNRRIGCGSPC